MAIIGLTLLPPFTSLQKCHLHETFLNAPILELHPPGPTDLPLLFCSIAFITLSDFPCLLPIFLFLVCVNSKAPYAPYCSQ